MVLLLFFLLWLVYIMRGLVGLGGPLHLVVTWEFIGHTCDSTWLLLHLILWLYLHVICITLPYLRIICSLSVRRYSNFFRGLFLYRHSNIWHVFCLLLKLTRNVIIRWIFMYTPLSWLFKDLLLLYWLRFLQQTLQSLLFVLSIGCWIGRFIYDVLITTTSKRFFLHNLLY
jgi:hypothetical protein